MEVGAKGPQGLIMGDRDSEELRLETGARHRENVSFSGSLGDRAKGRTGQACFLWCLSVCLIFLAPQGWGPHNEGEPLCSCGAGGFEEEACGPVSNVGTQSL